VTFACSLCGQLIERALPAGPGVPIVGDPNRGAMEYQATLQLFAGHLVQHHPDYPMTLAQVAQTYHLHLLAKLAVSADPAFIEERERARDLCYWTLRGDLEFSPAGRPEPTKPTEL
jgi:hypothetical protein